MTHPTGVSAINSDKSAEHTYRDDSGFHGSQEGRYISPWLGDTFHSQLNTDVPVYSPSHMCFVDKLRERGNVNPMN